MGKPIADSLTIDVPASANAIRWSAEAIDKLYDEVAPTPHDQLGLVTREPVGVVAAVVPWNFPLMMACWKLGGARHRQLGGAQALGKSPLTAIRVAQLPSRRVSRRGVQRAAGLRPYRRQGPCLHADVDTIVFTGSTGSPSSCWPIPANPT